MGYESIPGPMYYKGWYHLFYQYNPDAAVWGNITWGHSVSKDLINWLDLPFAMVPDHWYDINGVWTGSSTLLSNGSIVMIYTGSTNQSVQVQNVAFPANLSDPLLVDWVKYSGNPVLTPPPGIGVKDFRDPTTALQVSDKWQIVIGSRFNTTGIALVYETTDFLSYKLLDGLLHEVPTTGMWECVDFYPVSTTAANGLDTSVNGPGVKHVLKASLDDTKKDYYALGTYDSDTNTWTPDDPELDVGIGIRYDYGKYYASKTFYDQNKKRRILWSWIGETDSETADIKKGWSGVQGIPRVVTFDQKTKTNILQWPVQEVESLRHSSVEFDKIQVEAGSIIPLDVGTTTQLDITADLEIDAKAFEETTEADVIYNCSTSNGAAGRGALGPFGLLVLADESRSEQTAIYFYVAKGTDGHLKTFFCTDKSRSSKADDVGKEVYGSIVPVLGSEKLTMRILVDHSITEAFAQGGRTCITSRVYPTKAIDGAARLFLFNNATQTSVSVTSLKIWQMKSASIHPYPL
ncbi:Acid beta-fructofuranosidase [Thalictrum thalictroides]|uniref:Acid beta-fructofuranosidase n=1 Tax=Thalictrum thalictroides TaxID=46969 RepID=A0A7J6WDA6_THATH|nr:Acid beta-fructofuranosidase [Thalictrum thalictroides]